MSEWGLGASTESPLKAFLNPPKDSPILTGRPRHNIGDTKGFRHRTHLNTTPKVVTHPLLAALRRMSSSANWGFIAPSG